jgi:charged multivesicular body protein 5
VCTTQNAIQQRALRVLQQKKLYEGQLNQLQQQTFNMESAALTTDNLRNTMATVDAMKLANKEMRKQYGKIDIDKIEVCLMFYAVIQRLICCS